MVSIRMELSKDKCCRAVEFVLPFRGDVCDLFLKMDIWYIRLYKIFMFFACFFGGGNGSSFKFHLV